MGTTPVYGLRFPEGADTPDVPRDIENLALDVEAVVAAIPPPVSLDAVGNLLTANQASGTDTLATTAGFTPSGCTIASDATAAMQGTRGLAVTSAGTAANHVYLPSHAGLVGPAVSPGVTYTAVAKIKSPTYTGSVSLFINWWDAAGAAISGQFTDSVAISSTAVEVRHTAVAPANAATATLRITANTHASLAASTVWHIDALGLWAGAGGEWAMPGTPITNLGTKVEHPNTDDVATYVWDAGKARWQMEWYDSGRRDVAGMLVAPFANVLVCTLERTGRIVTLRIHASKGAYTPGQNLITIPTGFQPADGYIPIATWRGDTVQFGGPDAITVYNVVDSNLEFIAQWTTSQAIPPTLPGTLAEPAPN